MSKTAIVIGSGIAGLATAIRLKAKGYNVEVFEQNNYTGGKLTAFQQGDFRFDAGPSLFTSPESVDELFELMGENQKEKFKYIRLPIVCHYFFEDGTFIQAHAEPEKFGQEIESKLGVSSSKVIKYLKNSAFVYETTSPVFLEQSLHKVKNFINFKTLKGVLLMPWLGIFNRFNAHNQRWLSHPKLVQLFNRYATYNGSNPYECPGVMTAIPHLEFNQGAFFPKKGMHDISQSLYRLAENNGVKFHFNQKVEKIVVKHGIAKGIITNGEQRFSDVVVSNMDAWGTYRILLKDQPQPEKTLNQPRSSSALIFYWGINHNFKELDMHNIFFSKDYEHEFHSIFNENTVCDDPTVYINITSKHKPDDAPQAQQNWFVMVNVPPNKGQDWDALIALTKKAVLSKLSRLLKKDIEPLIINESILDPRSIESKTASYQGSLYGTSSNNRYAAFLRQANFSKQIQNLYFCGGSVHPGGGIPLCLLSAKIVSELIPKAN